MPFVWLNAVGQCLLSVCTICVSLRLCMPRRSLGTWGGGVGGVRAGGRRRGGAFRSVAVCLRLCLGWAGTVGNAAAIPISVLLSLRTPQCLYTCITLVCCPLLVRQFNMFLMLLLTLDTHLKHRLGIRYATVVTCQRALCLVLVSWLVSVVTAFAQFIGWNAQDTWGSTNDDGSIIDLGLGRPQGGNWSTPFPPPPKLPLPQDRSVIGTYLPYGGFLSKFLVTYSENYTYAEIHGTHWGVCAADTVLSPGFMVYVYSITVFMLPLLVLVAIYLDLMCVIPRLATGAATVGRLAVSVVDLPPTPSKQTLQPHARAVALSMSLLVLLCLPLHVSHVLQLMAPGNPQPPWAVMLTSLLFQAYGLVPALLFMERRGNEAGEPLPLVVASTAVAPPVSPRGKGMGRALCAAVQECTFCPSSTAPKTKVCPKA